MLLGMTRGAWVEPVTLVGDVVVLEPLSHEHHDGLEAAAAGGSAELAMWKQSATALGADWRRLLLVDAPLSPLRIGRQPTADDRRPLDEI